MRSLISFAVAVLVLMVVACTGGDEAGRSSDISQPTNPTAMKQFSPSADELAEIRSSPEFKAAQKRVEERVAASRPLPLAFVQRKLPTGVAAIIRLNQPGSKTRYAVVSSLDFQGTTLLHALGAESWYKSQRGDDTSQVTITVFADGSIIAQSKGLGEIRHQIWRNGPVQDTSSLTKSVLKELKKSKETFDVPGLGPAQYLARDTRS